MLSFYTQQCWQKSLNLKSRAFIQHYREFVIGNVQPISAKWRTLNKWPLCLQFQWYINASLLYKLSCYDTSYLVHNMLYRNGITVSRAWGRADLFLDIRIQVHVHLRLYTVRQTPTHALPSDRQRDGWSLNLFALEML